MLHIDILTAYLNCGISALAGSAILGFAAIDDTRLREALGCFRRGLVTLGIALLPAGLGPQAAHPVAQFSLTFGSLAGVLLMARGLGRMQGRDMPAAWIAALLSGVAVLCVGGWQAGPRVFGLGYAVALALACTLMAWSGRGFVHSPRDAVERALGILLLVVAACGWLRAGFTLAYAGPPRVHLLYMPEPLAPLVAALYGVIPIVLATLLLSMLNARLHQQLRTRAVTDELTGTMTRRAFGELAPALIERARHARVGVAVLMLDIDHFKAVNDTHGHATGDRVLKRVAAALQAGLRHDALLARYGGEEFVAVAPVEDLDAGRRVAERLRAAVEGADWRADEGLARGVTVSVGVALVGADGRLEDTLQRADQALYLAKREGRNRVQTRLHAA